MDIQKKVAGFTAKHGMEISVPLRLLDVLSEVGELAKEVLRSSEYGKRAFSPGPGWQDELGDVLFSLICVANSTGVDLEQAVDLALQKYENRLANRGDPGSE